MVYELDPHLLWFINHPSLLRFCSTRLIEPANPSKTTSTSRLQPSDCTFNLLLVGIRNAKLLTIPAQKLSKSAHHPKFIKSILVLFIQPSGGWGVTIDMLNFTLLVGDLHCRASARQTHKTTDPTPPKTTSGPTLQMAPSIFFCC